MSKNRAPGLRPERLIGTARVFLAVFTLFAVWLDPTEPAKNAELAYSLMAIYGAYSVTVAVMVWRVDALSPRWPLVTHIFDLVFFSLFIFFTEGPGSPFNAYFIFSLVCATMRWQFKGTVWTAVVVLGVFASFGAYFAWAIADPEFHVRAFVIRGVYLFLFATMLSYIGMYEQRLLRDMWLLSSWPQPTEPPTEPITRALVAHAAAVLEAPTIVLTWIATGDPVPHVATLASDGWTYSHNAAMPAVHSDLQAKAFLWSASNADRAMVQSALQPWRLEAWQGQAVLGDFASRYVARRVLSVPCAAEVVRGRLFVVNKAEMSGDDVLVAGIVASALASHLDAYYFDRQLQNAAATDERMKLARDLHDGILQSFTAIGLRLAAIGAELPASAREARAEFSTLQRLIADEQREVRFLIQDLRPSGTVSVQGLPERLAELRQRFQQEWDMDVSLSVETSRSLPRELSRDIYHIVREALTNAARHGLASAVNVRIGQDGDNRIRLSIADDGRGFSFTGTYTAEELASMGRGPRTLRERVQSRNGTMTLSSAPTGTALDISLPVAV